MKGLRSEFSIVRNGFISRNRAVDDKDVSSDSSRSARD